VECVVHASSEDRTVSEDENSGDGADIFLDIFYDPPLLELILPNTSQPRRVEDTNLKKKLPLHTVFKSIGTYQYAVVTRNVIKVRRGLILIANSALVENIEVVVINVFAMKGTGDEFHE